MSKVFHIDPENPSAEVINLAAGVLRDGGVVLFPTETVYGIGASMTSWCGAVELFDIKIRPLDKALPLLVEDASSLERYGVAVPEYARHLAAHFWPGGLTLVVQASPEVPKSFVAADGTVALRCPDHEVVQELIRASGAPIAATSANTSGKPPASSFEELEERIVAAADVALDGGLAHVGVASTVVNCTGADPVITREGPVASDEVMTVAQGMLS